MAKIFRIFHWPYPNWKEREITRIYINICEEPMKDFSGHKRALKALLSPSQGDVWVRNTPDAALVFLCHWLTATWLELSTEPMRRISQEEWCHIQGENQLLGSLSFIFPSGLTLALCSIQTHSCYTNVVLLWPRPAPVLFSHWLKCLLHSHLCTHTHQHNCTITVETQDIFKIN